MSKQTISKHKKQREKKFTSLAEFKKLALSNPQVKSAYEKLGPEFSIIRAIIEKRLKLGLTQSELAQKIGTKQSALSRLETGSSNPSLAFLKKVAAGLDSELIITLR